MRINPSLLKDVELVLPLKTDREIFTTEHISVVIQIGDYFGASLLDHRVHRSGPNRPPTMRIGRDRWSEDKGSFEGLLTKPSKFRSWCTAEGKFIFRLICMHLNEIGLQSWMFLDNLPLGEWVTGELEWLEKDSRNFNNDVVIEIDKNKVLEEVKAVQSMCVDHFFHIDGYF